MTDSPDEIEEVLSFWFGDLDADGFASPEVSAQWWKKDDAFDAAIAERFGPLIDAVAGGEREHLRSSARGALAFVVVLDQFRRNVYRGTDEMYAADHLALEAAAAAIDAGLDSELPTAMRCFLYMPLMHCESIEMQDRCVALFEGFCAEMPPEPRARLEGHTKSARWHRDIVARFGRFPHRNGILGRPSTEEEQAFLKEPGSSF